MSARNRILALLRDGVSESVFPGVVLLVARSKQNLFFEAVGHAALLPEPRPLTRHTRFDLASLTKPLATALAVLCQVSRGMLRLDARLPELIPSRLVPPDKAEITLGQLLCHCSGLPDWRPYYKTLETLPQNKRKEKLRQLILQEPLEWSPGTSTLYSDLGFLLIQWILEENSGKDLHVFTEQHVYTLLPCATPQFLPLDQQWNHRPHDVAATEHCPWRDRIISGEVHDENGYALGGVAGHAGLFGNASQVKCILDIILDTYGSEGHPLPWSQKDMDAFLRPARLDPNSTWALGFDTPAASGSSAGHHFSPRSVGHLGFTGTSFWLDLSREMTVILLTNRIHPSRDNDKIKKFRPLLHDAVMEEFA
jgi:CubicO group peptidase (beta-lactamase class C family)